MNSAKINIFWFRRDLRLDDNHGLYRALGAGLPVLPIFIFDEHFFQQFGENDKRFSLIYDRLLMLQKELQTYQSGLLVFRGKPIEVFEKITEAYRVNAIYCNEDYEPYSIERDNKLAAWLKNKDIQWCAYPDHVIFSPLSILKENNAPYTIFTPYKRKWLSRLSQEDYQAFPSQSIAHNFFKFIPNKFPACSDLGIQRRAYILKPLQTENIKDYLQYRDFPALQKTTSASVHLRFGFVSKRFLVRVAMQLRSEGYLSELIWHEFFTQILYHFPAVVSENFNPRYN
ncbi:MAG: deoxyribodipyrimidine photo-lyase, partial [Bacteroidales bacterium]